MDKDAHLRQGADAEALACRHLSAHGLSLVQRNYHCARGELDLIMRDGVELVFVEVRFRKHDHFGSGAESVDRRKQTKLIAAALHYLQHTQQHKQPCRFDVVAITPRGPSHTIDWIRDAFQN